MTFDPFFFSSKAEEERRYWINSGRGGRIGKGICIWLFWESWVAALYEIIYLGPFSGEAFSIESRLLLCGAFVDFCWVAVSDVRAQPRARPGPRFQ